MNDAVLSLDAAVELTRTGDLWLFRGRSTADHAIRVVTNAPVNHVGMAVVLDDLPPLMWHAELGRSLQDMWTGEFRRGVQLHDLRSAVQVWGERYGQRAFLRQLSLPPGTRDDPAGQARQAAMEEAVLRSVARLSGTPFPTTIRLARRWVGGRGARVRALRLPGRAGPGRAVTGRREESAGLESAYCAEVVASTYQAMGLLPADRAVNWYDPGRFWSGDDLRLLGGAGLGDEIAVAVPARRGR